MNNPIDSLETWMAFTVLSERGKTLEETAYELNINERRLREYIRDHAGDMSRRMQAEPDKVRRLRAELEERYPAEKREEGTLPNIDHRQVIKLLGERKTLDQVAKALKIDDATFRRWYSANLPVINKRLSKAG